KGEPIIRFDNELVKRWSGETGLQINSVYPPDTIANGMVICRFSVSEKNQWVTRYGALDKDGNLVIKPVFHKIHGFRNGTAQASLFLNSAKTEFKTQDREYNANYIFLDAGLIDKKGNWVQPAKKKLEYSYGSTAILYLTVTGPEWDRLTRAEKDAANARAELLKKQRHAEAMNRLESEVRSKVSSAQSQGYLIEKLK
ncbi:MAG TPA: WG repeat-containing protein, partial [Sphingobacteriaceae bacterium]